MSEERVISLTQENDNLKNQLNAVINTINQRSAEVDSLKEMMGETMNACVNLRANFKLCNGALEQHKFNLSESEKKVADLEAKLAAAHAAGYVVADPA